MARTKRTMTTAIRKGKKKRKKTLKLTIRMRVMTTIKTEVQAHRGRPRTRQVLALLSASSPQRFGALLALAQRKRWQDSHRSRG